MPIFPIHDGRALTHVARPYATWAIIAVNVIVYFFLEGGISRRRQLRLGLRLRPDPGDL